MIPGLGTVRWWRPPVESPFGRTVWPDAIPVEKFRRAEGAQPAQIARAPHPLPEVPARLAEPGEWPSQAKAALSAADLAGRWELYRSTYARGTDIEPKSGAPLGIVDSFVMGLRNAGGERVVVSWRRGDEVLCAGCTTPRKPTVAGLVRVHGDCAGGGQAGVLSGERARWEYGGGWIVRGGMLPGVLGGIEAVKAYVKGIK